MDYEKFKALALYRLGRSGGALAFDDFFEDLRPSVAGVDPLDVHLHLRRLEQVDRMVESYGGAFRLTSAGWQWIVQNRERLPYNG